jgi:hypothetical protein
MRSIPLAMMWETLRRGRWNLVTSALAANAVPFLLFSILGHEAAIDPDDSSQIQMHVVFVQIYPYIFGIAVLAAIGSPARLYALPIRTSTLVALQLLQTMTAVAAEVFVSTAVLNAMFGLRWPLWGPALFGAAAAVVLQAATWLADRSLWLAPAIALPGGTLGLWFKARYGPVFSRPTHYWDVVTPLDAATLVLIAVFAYGVAVAGVARNRRGEPPMSIGLVDWLRRIFVAPRAAGAPFRTPADAQLWFEWRKKGLAMPALVALGLVLGLGLWLVTVRDAKALYEGFVAGGALFVPAAFLCGLFMGHVGGRDGQLRIGHFLATRPMTTTDMARAILRCTAKSVLFGWLTWVVSFLALIGVLQAVGVGFPFKLPEPFGWWYLPATLVGAWAGCGVLYPLGLAGRQGLATGVIFWAVCLLVGLLLFSKLVLSREGQEQFIRWGLAALAIVLVAGTAAAFVAARRRSLIGMPTILTAAGAWGFASALVAFGRFAAPADVLIAACVAAGVLALAVSPLATAPLALAWNRNR